LPGGAIGNTIPAMENGVSLADRAVERTLAGRQSAYAEEVRRLIDAGIAVMQRAGGESPRVSDIVDEAGLSNQAFYRHFRGKDELLAAILDDGLRTLMEYLGHQMAKERRPDAQIRRWIEGIMAQATDAKAAEATRAVTMNSNRLNEEFAAETRRSQELMRSLLVQPLTAMGSPDVERDAQAIYQLVLASMHDHLWRRQRPSRADVAHLVGFCLAGVEKD
jgi:AcrR family transcriptional regulator